MDYASVPHLSGRINFVISKDAALDIIASKAQYYPGSENEVQQQNYNEYKMKIRQHVCTFKIHFKILILTFKIPVLTAVIRGSLPVACCEAFLLRIFCEIRQTCIHF
jgi:hypothetical protein